MSARGGIDLGGTKIQAVVVGPDHRVIGDARRPTPTGGGPAGVAAAMADALEQAAADAGAAVGDLAGIGVGSPGLVDEQAGTVASARNLPDWEGAYGLAEVLGERLGTPVRIGNDVQVATDGEHRLGAGRPYDSLIGVYWGTGVGGGLVLGGKAWVGRGGAGEIGHVVVRRGGARCPCGRRGCLEAYAGRAAMEAKARREHERGTKTELFHIMRKRGRDRLTSGIWARALDHDDKLAIELLERAVAALGTGIASAVNLLDVEAVIIGGGMGLRMGEPFVERIGEAMTPHLFDDANPPDLRLASLGDLGGAIGASLLVEG